jgi:hypothetical protein
MSKSGRNRSQGWRHAKLDGHINEKLFSEKLISNSNLLKKIEKSVLRKSPKGKPIIKVDGAKHVKSIFGDTTTSKVDLAIEWPEGEIVNISLKKSDGGQVWLISVSRFIAAIEFHLGSKIDPEVQVGISLFIGGTNLYNYKKMYEAALTSDNRIFPKIAIQELHQARLVASSISANYSSVWESTLNFFNNHVGLITRLSFSQGLAMSEADCADIIIYNNVPTSKNIFLISEVISAAEKQIKETPMAPGLRNGGSTLLLPTGFLQMHRPQGDNQLQFHHQYKKISML